jgi:F-type H+-transporting ATPase subunit gamma
MIREQYAKQLNEGNVKVLCIGKKASDFFSKMKNNVYAGNHNDIYTHLQFDAASEIAEEVMKEFAEGNYDRVEIVYNQFKNAAVQYVQVEQLLPISPPAKKEKENKKVNDYIFEPEKEQLVLELIPKSVKIQLYKALLDSHASEHGARMTAMNKATDNAGDMLKALRLEYNKRRQAAITGEILEIVAGAEALNG